MNPDRVQEDQVSAVRRRPQQKVLRTDRRPTPLLLEIITNPIVLPTSSTTMPARTPSRTLRGLLLERRAATSSTTTPRRKMPAVPAAPPRMSAASNGVLKL